MKKMLIAVFAVAAYCLAANPAPYTGLLKNLNIATFGIKKYQKLYGNDEHDLPDNVNYATQFRNSLENHVSKKYPGTTFEGSYSNSKSKEVTISFFLEEIQNNHNIVMFSGHGSSEYDGSTVVRHNKAVMFDGRVYVEDMIFSEATYFVFMDACNFLSFYTDDDDRKKYGFYYRYSGNRGLVIDENTEFSLDDADGWEDSQDAKPQNLAYGRFKNAFKNGLHAMFGFSSSTPMLLKEGTLKADPALYETFAQKWVDEGLRIWPAYKYAVWKHIYKERSRGIEPAVIFRKGTATGNDGKSHSFKGYCEYYKSIYQGSMKSESLALGRKKAVYGFPSY